MGGVTRRLTWVAWGLASLGLLMFAATSWLGFLRGGRVLMFGSPPQTWLDVIAGAPFALIPLVGAVIISRQPKNPVGWLFALSGVATVTANFAGEYGVAAIMLHQPLPLGQAVWWLSNWVWVFGSAAVPLVLLLFPDGHLVSKRWRGVAAAAVVNLVGVAIIQMLLPDPTGQSPIPNPLGLPPVAPLGKVLVKIEAPVLLALVLLGLVSFGLRYRRSNSEVRHQLKWIAFAVLFVPVSLLVSNFANPGPGTPSSSPLTVAATVLQAASVSLFVSAVAISMLKYRLYDIDVVISRTLVYASLAALITGVYVGIVVGVGSLIGAGGRSNLFLSIVATAIVAVGFQPVRERLQGFANRLVYGRRATPYEVLAEFSENVAETLASDEVLPRMARVLAEGTGAESARVWLHDRPVATFGSNGDAADTLNVEVRHQGEVLGALSVRKRRGESLTPIEQKLVEDLAQQAGLVLKNVGLTADLQARLIDLRESRKRLVSAQDEERRKLERNLHDGAQQNLVALKVKLGLAEMMADRDPTKAVALIQELKSETDETLETLRDLARGIYPPLLADKGLKDALEAQARKATLPVTVEAVGIGRYPQDIEAAVYFCVLEALQNVQKYAEASKATVRLSEQAGELRFEVEDDGRGFDISSASRGAGTTNMADRLDALGGSIRIDSAPGAGATVGGWLPIEPVAVAG